MSRIPYERNPIWAAVVFCVVGALPLSAVVLDVGGADVVDGVTVWRGVDATTGGFIIDSGGKSGNNTGILDQQTGQGVADMVGTTTAPTFYIGYGTVGGVDHIGFRVRLNKLDTLAAIKQVTYMGFDFDGNGSADMFVGADTKDQQSKWGVVIADTDNSGTNSSPSTTTITYGQGVTPLYFLPSNGTDSHINYQQVTAANAIVGGDIQMSGDADAFITWALPFADFVAAIQNPLVMGPSFSFTPDTVYRISAATTQQANNINQDAMSGMDVSFNFSSPISSSGAPVPEPSSVVIFGALMAPAFITMARRHWRSRSSETKGS